MALYKKTENGRSKTLVMGMGNLLLADEGAGVHAAHRLLKEAVPAGTTVLDVGTAVLDALEELSKTERVIIMDAMKAGGRPGGIYRVALEDCRKPEIIGSMHGFDISRVLALTRRAHLPEIMVIGIEPAVIDWSMDLSPAVEAAMPAFLKTVRSEIGRRRHFGLRT